MPATALRRADAWALDRTTEVGSLDGLAAEIRPNPVTITAPVAGIETAGCDLPWTTMMARPMMTANDTTIEAKRFHDRKVVA